MLEKIAVAARTINIIVAVVAGITVIPGVDVNLVLILAGLLGGLSFKVEQVVPRLVTAVALPVVATVLADIPMIGTEVGAIFTNLGIAVAASAAMTITIATIRFLKNETVQLFALGENS